MRTQTNQSNSNFIPQLSEYEQGVMSFLFDEELLESSSEEFKRGYNEQKDKDNG
jgi:hypothetical protein